LLFLPGTVRVQGPWLDAKGILIWPLRLAAHLLWDLIQRTSVASYLDQIPNCCQSFENLTLRATSRTALACDPELNPLTATGGLEFWSSSTEIAFYILGKFPVWSNLSTWVWAGPLAAARPSKRFPSLCPPGPRRRWSPLS